LSGTIKSLIEKPRVADVSNIPESAPPSPDQTQFDRELALLKEANAAVYAKKTPWPTKR
jgi:hypothetical protein